MNTIPNVLFEDEDIIAINKPHGLLVHPTSIARDATEFALYQVRDYVKSRVFPAHRLDRKTSGVLLFSKNAETNKSVQKLFRERQITKSYKAIVRGFINEAGVIDYPLMYNDKLQEAKTTFKPIEQFEIDVPFGKYKTSRYTLMTLEPETGRFHQLRKHMAHIFHPIIGDRPHGCNKQNKLWKEQFGISEMMLHAKSIEFEWHNSITNIEAKESTAFQLMLAVLHQKNISNVRHIDHS